jgi:hypothetical protein
VKRVLLICTPLLAVSAAIAYKPAEERELQLRADRTPVVATLKCLGGATPTARNLSYVTADRSRESVTF